MIHIDSHSSSVNMYHQMDLVIFHLAGRPGTT